MAGIELFLPEKWIERYDSGQGSVLENDGEVVTIDGETITALFSDCVELVVTTEVSEGPVIKKPDRNILVWVHFVTGERLGCGDTGISSAGRFVHVVDFQSTVLATGAFAGPRAASSADFPISGQDSRMTASRAFF